MKALKSKKGFTLIEVIVILAVIAILAAVLTPMIIGYISDARKSAAQSDVKIIATAVQAFNRDMKDWPIWATNTDRKLSTSTAVLNGLASNDGDTPGTTNVPSTPLGSIEEQLMTNPTTVGYPTTGSSKWKGPYLEKVTADPWGNRYYVVAAGLQPAKISLTGAAFESAYVISAGPNKVIDTAYAAGLTVTPAEDDILFRIK